MSYRRHAARGVASVSAPWAQNDKAQAMHPHNNKRRPRPARHG
ncbi:hypothetical protein [Pseudorhodoferax sp. Leaf265]|nr:hypothetical protein [Pseudorhodoferax sp. Leaf265]